MQRKLLEQILENLDNTCFPIQINWNNKELYLDGLGAAINKMLRDNGYVIVSEEFAK